MDETSNEIEARIDRTRERLGSNFRQLEDKFDAATDWREHVRERPELWLGVAFVGGMLLAGVLKTRTGGRASTAVSATPAAGGAGAVKAQARQFLNNMQGALVGVASARIQEYINELVPGFNEHYQRAEQRTAAPR